MRIEEDIKLDFDDVLIKPKRSNAKSRSEVSLDRDYSFMYSGQYMTKCPIMSANMDTTGSIKMAEALNKLGCYGVLSKHIDFEQAVSKANEYAGFVTLGISDEEYQRAKNMRWLRPDKICIDAANGYTSYFVERVAQYRQMYPKAIIMAGNVSTPEMVQEILLNGKADIVKIGIGPGSVCTTRKVTGCGYPQLSAIAECADAAHGLTNDRGICGKICADGGCKTPGDVAKAFCAGADFVMLGGMLAGCEECIGEWEYENIYYAERVNLPDGSFTYTTNKKDGNKKKALRFYGMSSKVAQEKHNGGLAEHRAAEGKEVSIPYKGYAKDVINEIKGGLRSCCTYIGASTLKDMPKCATFIKVNRTHNTVYGN